MEVRVLDPGDSSIAGGAGYTFVNNRAQLGDSLSINIANSDTQNETYYLNKLLTIVEGEGRGHMVTLQVMIGTQVELFRT